MTPARTIGIVGLGLVGGSLALDLREREVPVVGTDTDATQRDLAARAGIEVVDDTAAVAARADLVVVAVPPADVGATVRTVTTRAPGAVVTDVASVKAPATLGLADPPRQWIGGHPMAGTERTGFVAARPGMLAGATWLLTPADTVDRDGLVAVLELVLAVQAVPVVLAPDDHDRLVATVSHVTHLLSFALHGVAGGLGREVVDLVAGPSFRDATRVAASDPGFWADVVRRNHDAVVDVLAQVQDWLSAAAADDVDQLADRLAAARRTPLSPHRDDPVAVDLDDLPVALHRMRALGLEGHAVTAVERTRDGVRLRVARR